MMREDGNLSIDFLAGFTIFIVALIMVANMVPGLLLGLTSSTIDYDAVAYRTSVILAEDPGMPVAPAWELTDTDHKDEVTRMGFSVATDVPGILSPVKLERFFSDDFEYPTDYHERVFFGDIPYRFNISLRTYDDRIHVQRGDLLPPGYGYIRRGVMVKETSNTTVDATRFQDTADNSSSRVFHVDFNFLSLLDASHRPEYRIDPFHERIRVNITGISGTLYDAYNTTWTKDVTTLSSARIYMDGSFVPPDRQVYVDGSSIPVTPPCTVRNDIAIILEPSFITQIADTDSQVMIEYTFDDGLYPRNTTFSGNYLYDYTANVTRPELHPAVLEVSVW